jgi:hypothetical protein
VRSEVFVLCTWACTTMSMHDSSQLVEGFSTAGRAHVCALGGLKLRSQQLFTWTATLSMMLGQRRAVHPFACTRIKQHAVESKGLVLSCLTVLAGVTTWDESSRKATQYICRPFKPTNTPKTSWMC